MPKNLHETKEQARAAIETAILEGYAPYQEAVDAIIKRAEKFEGHYKLRAEDIQPFIELRLAGIKSAGRRAVAVIAEHPNFLDAEERTPLDSNSPKGYRKSGPIIDDKEHHVFAYTFVFAPHQITGVHDHPGECLAIVLEGDGTQTLFQPDKEGKFRPVLVAGENSINEPIGPGHAADAHTVTNAHPYKIMIRFHIYDAWMTPELLDKGIVRSQHDMRPVRNGVYNVNFDAPGQYPSAPGKLNPGESPIQLASDAEWAEKILRAPLAPDKIQR